MKSTVETLEPTKVRLTVEVPFEELKSEMDKAYKEIAGQVNIPGFRKGHVPPRIIDQRFGRAAVIEQVVNQVLPGHYSDAVSENDLRPLAQPTVDVTEIPNVTGAQGGQLVFTAEVDVVPAFELPEIDESIVVEVAPPRSPTRTWRRNSKTCVAASPPSRPSTTRPRPATSPPSTWLPPSTASRLTPPPTSPTRSAPAPMLDGQDTALRGTKAGEEVTFTSKLKGGEHEGEEAEVTITIKAMKTRELPKADDDFAQMVSEFDTIDELKEDLKKQAAESKESQQALAARDALIDVLLGKVEIVLPESAVDHQVEHRVGEDAKPKAKKEACEAVEKEMRTELLSEALAKKFDVQVSQQELIDYAIQMSQNFGIDINQLFSSSQQMANVVATWVAPRPSSEALRSSLSRTPTAPTST